MPAKETTMPERQLNVAACRELVAYMHRLTPSQFNMGWVFRPNENDTGPYRSFAVPVDKHRCGTAACIAGLCAFLAGAGPGELWGTSKAADYLGLTDVQNEALFTPDGWLNDREGNQRYPLFRAIATLERLVSHYEATGKVVVDWGPEPGDEPKRPWSAPVVSGGLPLSLTIALDAPAPSLVRETTR